MDLKGKRVLITAGPTWVPIDTVRVISNRATGETGILLSERLAKKGARVTLVLGPGCFACIHQKVKIIRFTFFNELRDIMVKELTANRYDAIIHSAAVSDFRPEHTIKGKLSSNKAHALKLIALPKIIEYIKDRAPLAKLIMFKLESGVTDKELIRRAHKALRERNADFVVANRVEPHYKAYLLDGTKILAEAASKKQLIHKVTGLMRNIWN